MVWYVDAPQKVTNRVVDEDELDYLLQNRIFVQYICAVQVYFGGYPLKGCGWFEHRLWVTNTGREMHETFELALPPEQSETLDMNKFLSGIAVGDKPIVKALGGASADRDERLPDGPRRLVITESQAAYLRPITSKLTRYMEIYSKCRVVNAVFMIGFNSTWAPFVIGLKDVQLRDVPATVVVMRQKMFSSLDNMFTRVMQFAAENAQQQGIAPRPVRKEEQQSAAGGSPKGANRKKPAFMAQKSRMDSMDMIPSFNYGTSPKAAAAESPEPVKPRDPNAPLSISDVPKPTGKGHAGGVTDFSRREETPASSSVGLAKLVRGASTLPGDGPLPPATTAAAAPASAEPPRSHKADRAVGSGTSALPPPISSAGASALQNYALAYGIGYRTQLLGGGGGGGKEDLEAERRVQQRHDNIMKDAQREMQRPTLAQTAVQASSSYHSKEKPGMSAPRSQTLTETWSRRVKAYPSMVRGSMDESWEEFKRTLHPVSPPLSPGAAALAKSASG
jgi:hypothetical protein